MNDTIQVVIMQAAEAMILVQRIRDGLNTIADDLWQLKDREGWRSLGYESWRECAMKEFGFSQARVYQLLTYAEVVQNIAADSTQVEKPTSERQTRPLNQLPATVQPEAWKKAQEESGTSQPTPAQVTQAARQFTPIPKPTKSGSKTKSSTGYSGGDNQGSRSSDFSQAALDDDFNQDTASNGKRRKSLEEQAAIGLLERIGYSVIPPEAADEETCAYCGKPFK